MRAAQKLLPVNAEVSGPGGDPAVPAEHAPQDAGVAEREDGPERGQGGLPGGATAAGPPHSGPPARHRSTGATPLPTPGTALLPPGQHRLVSPSLPVYTLPTVADKNRD